MLRLKARREAMGEKRNLFNFIRYNINEEIRRKEVFI